MNILKLKNINYKIKKKVILDNISFNLKKGEILTIVGPNGAGKTTLLEIILGLLKPVSGQVVKDKKLNIGFVPQHINKDQSLPTNVSEFISLARNKSEENSVDKILETLLITKLKEQFLCDLSGGELRKVLFARAIINNPDLLVLDEPTAGVDEVGQVEFYKLITKLQSKYDFAVLMVSHDLHLVMSATDKVLCLNKHICCSGKPSQVVENPEYINIFGKNKEVAYYNHSHNHSHD